MIHKNFTGKILAVLSKIAGVSILCASVSCGSAPAPVPKPAVSEESPAISEESPAEEEPTVEGEINFDVLADSVLKAHDSIIERIPAKTKIALVDVQASDPYIKDFIFEDFVSYLVNTRKYVVVDRYHLDLVKAEQNLQLSGDFSDDSIVSIGRMLGARMVLSASIAPRGKNYSLRFRLHDVETAEILAIVTELIPIEAFGEVK